MRVLILDDQKCRHDHYDHVFAGHEVVHTWTFSDLMAHLWLAGPWDLVQLDHDIGQDVLPNGQTADTYVDGWGKTRFRNGGHVAARMCEMPEWMWPGRVVIHSHNPGGAFAMCSMLVKVGIVAVREPYEGPNDDVDPDALVVWPLGSNILKEEE